MNESDKENLDPHHGHGGVYNLDPATGRRTRIQDPTKPDGPPPIDGAAPAAAAGEPPIKKSRQTRAKKGASVPAAGTPLPPTELAS